MAQRSIASISLEPVRAGSAAEIHLAEVARGLEESGWRVVRSWQKSTRSNKLRAFELIAFQFRSVRIFRHVDILYFRWHVLGLIMYACAIAMRKPYVLEVNGTADDIVLNHPSLNIFSPWLRRATRWQIRHAAHVVAVAPGLADWVDLNSGGRVPVTFLPNGAPDAIVGLRSAPESPPYVVFVGELAEWQGVDTLIEARRSTLWPSELELVIVGSGRLSPLVEKAGGDGIISYCGRLDRDAANSAMARATVSVSPQTRRVARNLLGVTPLKVAESLMLGVPTVVSDLPGQAEIVRDAPHCRVFEADDPSSLAREIKAASHASLQERDEIAQYGMERLSWRGISRSISELCETVHLSRRIVP
ncbi:glycosyltransferase family 4 protein [Georgenia sp. M64]|uniref:glycosyltransferase family 4 protein n=1 Tax=Georgenia sp. M64 TaxID=3120520 RepID=UPI0030DE1C9F